MNRNKAEKVEQIFCSALEIRKADEQKAFLDQACLGDDNLRRQVDEMLALRPKLDKVFPEGGCPFILDDDILGGNAKDCSISPSNNQ